MHYNNMNYNEYPGMYRKYMSNEYDHYMQKEPKHMPYEMKNEIMHLKGQILNEIKPIIEGGLNEARYKGLEHVIKEVAMKAYLIGKGYPKEQAHLIVDAWEKKEKF